jgi:hypothetical protein
VKIAGLFQPNDPKGVFRMKRKMSVLLTAAAVLLISMGAWAGGFSLGVKGGYFWPSDGFFKDIYKNGPVFGGEIAVSTLRHLDIWAGGDFFSKTGKLTFTEEETKIRITTLCAGLRYRFSQGSISPYLAAAGGLYLYKEENVLGPASGTGLGIIGQGGVLFKVFKALAFDLHGCYGLCKVKSEEIEKSVDLGGFQTGATLVLRFQN